MTNFIGRNEELIGLNRQHASDKFEFSVIYGRRRIGKTWLIQQFIADKAAIYFMGIEAGAGYNLEALSQAVHKFTGQSFLPPYRSFTDIFSAIAELAKAKRLILVIDEFPYVAAAAPETTSLLQRFCDHDWHETRLHLILCGSSMSFMEHQVLGAKSPLYGRRTAQYKLNPFTFFESREYLKSHSLEDAAILHAATGGVAEYLSHINQNAPLSEVLTDLFLNSSGRLYEEPSNLLKQELREPRVYNDILDAIANGASRSNEIATKTNLQSGAIHHYLDSLIDLGIVLREQPMMNSQRRKTIYRIRDGLFRFWYRFVMPNQSAIMSGLGEQLFSKVIAPAIPEFMGQGFESIFYDFFDSWNRNGKLPDLVTERGRWWGNNSQERREEEIDLLGLGTRVTFFGEAKWNREKMDLAVLRALEQKSLLLPAKERCYILFAKAGYTSAVVKEANARDNMLLIPFSDPD